MATTTNEVRIVARLPEPLPALDLAAGCEVHIHMPPRRGDLAVTRALLAHMLAAGDFLSEPIDPAALLAPGAPFATYAVLSAGGGEVAKVAGDPAASAAGFSRCSHGRAAWVQ